MIYKSELAVMKTVTLVYMLTKTQISIFVMVYGSIMIGLYGENNKATQLSD